MKKYITNIKRVFTPFEEIKQRSLLIMTITQVLFLLLILQFNKSELLPTPLIVIQNFFKLIISEEFLDNLLNSLFLMVKGMGVAIFLASLLGYISTIPFFKYIIKIIASFRYLTLTGTSVIFTMYSKDTGTLRTNLLLFSIIPFFLISMLDVISKTNKSDVELCMTLRMGRFKTLWEVIIIGKLHEVIEVIRSNFAIAWMMITTVEGVAFNLGGVGTLLIKASKYVKMNDILPIILSVLLIGMLTDYLLNVLRNAFFPYAKLSKI